METAMLRLFNGFESYPEVVLLSLYTINILP